MAGYLEQALSGRVGTFFLVLPDCDSVRMVAKRAQAIAANLQHHASGRLWLAGRWPDEEFSVTSEGDTRVAHLGSFLRRGGRGGAGSYHLITSRRGEVSVQGTASGLRLVFYARVGGVTVAASRADALADLIGAGLDEQQIAVRLLSFVPHPLPLTPLWHGVHTVEPGSRLRMDAGGRAAVERWWTPPVPQQPLAVGAQQVQAALSEAVAARTEAGGTVTCDLSGGMDSTAICFLAAGGPAKVVARTMTNPDPASSDLSWARRAVEHLPDVEHVVMSGENWPLRYAGLDGFDDLMDEPTNAVISRSELMRFYYPLSARGGRVHLTGIGGDHVTWCGPSHYHDLLPHRPLLALRRLRGFRALHHWPIGETLRALADRKPYHRWLLASAAGLHRPPPKLEWTLGWSSPPQLPGWVTSDAAASVRDVIVRAAGRAEPIAPARGPHVELAAIRHGGRWLRQVEQMCATAGLPIASPFLDDAVIEACLSIRPEDRVTPWSYRPVLQAALRDIVPEGCLRRSTKDVFALPAARSLAEHRAELLGLWDGSRLAQLGIVDEQRIRASISSTMTHIEQDPLDITLSVELWLRTLAGRKEDRPQWT